MLPLKVHLTVLCRFAIVTGTRMFEPAGKKRESDIMSLLDGPPIEAGPARLNLLRKSLALADLASTVAALAIEVLSAVPEPDDPHARCAACGQRYRRPHLLHCRQCGEPFQSSKPDAKYCGGTCRQRGQRGGVPRVSK